MHMDEPSCIARRCSSSPLASALAWRHFFILFFFFFNDTATTEIYTVSDTLSLHDALPISQKPAEVRMGNGKGNPEYYVAEIQPGKVLYEINGVPEELAREAFQLASAKLPLKTTFVARQVGA